MPNEKLLGCPFCGEEPTVVKHGGCVRIKCLNFRCAIYGNRCSLKEWQTRTPPPELVELRKDKERLDLVCGLLLLISYNQSDPETEGFYMVRRGGKLIGTGSTPRTAIDAAMKEKHP